MMKLISLFFVLVSVFSVEAFSYQCFEVKITSPEMYEGIRIKDGKSLELTFRPRKVKMKYIESGDVTRYTAQIIKKNDYQGGEDVMGAIDSDMYTLIVKESPPFYIETIEQKGYILASFYMNSSTEIKMFCDFIDQKYRFY